MPGMGKLLWFLTSICLVGSMLDDHWVMAEVSIQSRHRLWRIREVVFIDKKRSYFSLQGFDALCLECECAPLPSWGQQSC
jgi:hypothetical protein